MNEETRRALTPDIAAFLVVVLTLLFAAVILILLLKTVQISGEAGTLLTALVSMLTGSVTTIIAFYFGDSKRSQSQAKTISDVATANVTNGHSPATTTVDTMNVAGDVKVTEQPKPGAEPLAEAVSHESNDQPKN